jgi:dihydroorotate dehydrogenase (fumarate)
MNLETTYLGLKLRTPLVVSASPLSDRVEGIKRMEDVGAAAVVLHSLFEEQIRLEAQRHNWTTAQGTESFPEALNYLPDPRDLSIGPRDYLRHIAKARKAVKIPVIASLNGSTPGGWVGIARQIEDAGAHAIELNLYTVPTDPDVPGSVLEQRHVDVVNSVKQEVRIPVAVKLSPFYTNVANMGARLDAIGANALVLFNRFYQPDIELETLDVIPIAGYSHPQELRLPLRWISLLFGRVNASLAATGGIHSGTDAIKLLLAGADVTMVCSALMMHGLDHLRAMEQQMTGWLTDHEYESVEQLKGSLSHRNCPDPGGFERAHYLRAIGVHPSG